MATKQSAPALVSHRVKVTAAAIKKAKPQHSRHCMVAQAIREQIPGTASIDVDASRIKFSLDGWRYQYDTPGRVGADIVVFDDRGAAAVKPFAFTLDRRQCAYAPVMTKGMRKKSKHGEGKTRKASPRRACVRRYHGIKVVSEA